MNELRFELLGHSCMLSTYPAPVIAIGRFGNRTVAVYPGSEAEFDPEKNRIEGPDFVHHGPQLQGKLKDFDFRNDCLFAYSEEDVVRYKKDEEQNFLLYFLRDARYLASDPFVRMTLARTAGNRGLILKEIGRCLVDLSDESERYAQEWCEGELVDLWRDASFEDPPEQAPHDDLSISYQQEYNQDEKPRRQLILIADDQRDAAQLLEVHFTQMGFDTCIAYDGESALSLAKTRRPDVVLLDINMPVQDGWYVLQGMKSDPKCAAIPVIVVSAVVQDPQIAIARGAIQCLPKSFPLSRIDQEV